MFASSRDRYSYRDRKLVRFRANLICGAGANQLERLTVARDGDLDRLEAIKRENAI